MYPVLRYGGSSGGSNGGSRMKAVFVEEDTAGVVRKVEDLEHFAIWNRNSGYSCAEAATDQRAFKRFIQLKSERVRRLIT